MRPLIKEKRINLIFFEKVSSVIGIDEARKLLRESREKIERHEGN